MTAAQRFQESFKKRMERLHKQKLKLAQPKKIAVRYCVDIKHPWACGVEYSCPTLRPER